jgi:hypothetical protein
MTVKNFFGYSCCVLGLIVAVLCGGCTLFFVLTSMFQHGGGTTVGIALAVGGLPALAGFGIHKIGIAILRKKPEEIRR